MNFLNQLLIVANQCRRDDFATAHVSAQTHTHTYGARDTIHHCPHRRRSSCTQRRPGEERMQRERERVAMTFWVASRWQTDKTQHTHTHTKQTYKAFAAAEMEMQRTARPANSNNNSIRSYQIHLTRSATIQQCRHGGHKCRVNKIFLS